MPPKHQMSIMIRGQHFKNVPAAARKFKVTTARVYEAAARGTLDKIGIGKGKHDNHVISKAVPITLGGKEFKSKAEASRWLGKNPRYIDCIERRGQLDTIHALVAKRLVEEEDEKLAALLRAEGQKTLAAMKRMEMVDHKALTPEQRLKSRNFRRARSGLTPISETC